MLFPIVESTENINPEAFKDPEAIVKEKSLGVISISNDALAAKITQEAKAGRAVYLQAKTVDRMDGTFIIAAVITTGPAGSVSSMPAVVTGLQAETNKLDEIVKIGTDAGAPVSGASAGGGSGSGSGAGSGSGPEAV